MRYKINKGVYLYHLLLSRLHYGVEDVIYDRWQSQGSAAKDVEKIEKELAAQIPNTWLPIEDEVGFLTGAWLPIQK